MKKIIENSVYFNNNEIECIIEEIRNGIKKGVCFWKNPHSESMDRMRDSGCDSAVESGISDYVIENFTEDNCNIFTFEIESTSIDCALLSEFGKFVIPIKNTGGDSNINSTEESDNNDAGFCSIDKIRNQTRVFFVVKNQEINSMNECVSKMNDEIKRMDDSKSRIFSIISHDLRGPMGNVVSMLDVCEDMHRQNRCCEVNEVLKLTRNAAQNCYDLLDHLLVWSRLQLKSIRPQKSPISLHSIITEIESLNLKNLEEKGIRIENRVSENFMIFADIEMIKVVCRNLINNAIKFSNMNSTIIVESMVCGFVDLVSIIDFGVGIPAEKLNDFFRNKDIESTYGTCGERGTGLGLQLSMDLMAANDGELIIESEVGEGTKVLLKFPKC